MKQFFALGILLLNLSLFGQDLVLTGTIIDVPERTTLNQQFSDFQLFEISTATIESTTHAKSFTNYVILQLEHFEEWNLELHENDIRAANYKLRVASDTGIETKRNSANQSFIGYNLCSNGGRVLATMRNDFFFASILDNETEYIIEKASRMDKQFGEDTYVVYKTSDVIYGSDNFCGVSQAQEEKARMLRQSKEQNNSQLEKSMACIEVEYGVAGDYLLYQENSNSVANTESHILSIVNLVNGDYAGVFDDDLTFVVVEYFISSCNTCDPWSSSTDVDVLLSSFGGWTSSGFTADFDVASLFSDRDFDGSTIGYAPVGVVCTSSAYNIIQDYSSNSQSMRVVTSHELGHNFNAWHDPESQIGITIMAPAAAASAATWSTASQNSINNYVDDVNCLDPCGSSGPICLAITSIDIINCNSITGKHSVYVSFTNPGLTGNIGVSVGSAAQNTILNGQSTQTVIFNNLFSNGENDIPVVVYHFGEDCSSSDVYNAPNVACVCTNFTNESFNGGLPSGWSTTHTNSNLNTIGSCQDGSSFFSFSCSGEYPGQASGSSSEAPDDFQGSIAVFDDDNIGNGGGTVGTGCILTDVYDLDNFSDISLDFDYQVEVTANGSGYGIFTVEVYTGSSWLTILNYDGDTEGHYGMEIDQYKNPNFQVRFCYYDEGEWAWGAAIDNVQVCGYPLSSCSDGLMNGSETGIDCGGNCPPCTLEGCTDEFAHNYNPDANIENGSCESCNDGILNGDEEEIDCGGNNPYCIACPTCEDNVLNGDEWGVDCGSSECGPCTVALNTKFFLEGFYDADLNKMTSNLVENGTLPITQPFNFPPFLYNGGEFVQNNDSFPNDIVDWVLLELRDPNDWYYVYARKAVFLKEDGTLVDEFGNNGVTFYDVLPGQYRIAIFHKSHLPVLSKYNLTLPNPVEQNFSTNMSSVEGINQMNQVDNNRFGLIAGDLDGNATINNVDFNFWNQNSATVGVYGPEDIDGNGIVNVADFNLWLKNSSKVGLFLFLE